MSYQNVFCFNFIFNTSLPFLNSISIFLCSASISWFLKLKTYKGPSHALSHSWLFFLYLHLPIKLCLWCFGTLFYTFHLIKYIHLFIGKASFKIILKILVHIFSIILIVAFYFFISYGSHLNNQVCVSMFLSILILSDIYVYTYIIFAHFLFSKKALL